MFSPVGSSVTRSLPARPSLEFERKQARKLLNQMRKADSAALERAREQLGERVAAPERFKLADAQLLIAREYGFGSWPRLVEYFHTLERQQHPDVFRELPHGDFERRAQNCLRMHQRRDSYTGRSLGAFVPRFYGATLDEIFASTISIDDAQLAIAREEGFPSWEVLKQETVRTRNPWDYYESPMRQAHQALDAHDLAALQRIVGAHPELVAPRRPHERFDLTLIYSALGREMKSGWNAERDKVSGWPVNRELTDLLVALGADLSDALNHMLLGGIHMPTERVAYLLERGADPNWLPPNGITVLEHALVRYWNGAAADLIAARVVPRRALWIAAGLGDVRALDRYFDRHGQPNDAALRQRPDFRAMFPRGFVAPLVITDPQEVVWEAFFVAVLNSRFDVLDALLERGFPIDYLGHGMSALNFAVGNRMVALVEFLVQRGANPELAQRYHAPRENAESNFQSNPDEQTRRILELVAGRELAPEPRSEPGEPARLVPHVEKALELAREEAHRLGQPVVEPHNILVAMLRDEPHTLLHLLNRAGVDIPQLREALAQRLVLAQGASIPEVPLSADASAVLDAAKEDGESNAHGVINTFVVLDALLRLDKGDIERMLNAAGGTTKRVRQALSRYFE
jgi:hypothetical protein